VVDRKIKSPFAGRTRVFQHLLAPPAGNHGALEAVGED